MITCSAIIIDVGGKGNLLWGRCHKGHILLSQLILSLIDPHLPSLTCYLLGCKIGKLHCYWNHWVGAPFEEPNGLLDPSIFLNIGPWHVDNLQY